MALRTSDLMNILLTKDATNTILLNKVRLTDDVKVLIRLDCTLKKNQTAGSIYITTISEENKQVEKMYFPGCNPNAIDPFSISVSIDPIILSSKNQIISFRSDEGLDLSNTKVLINEREEVFKYISALTPYSILENKFNDSNTIVVYLSNKYFNLNSYHINELIQANNITNSLRYLISGANTDSNLTIWSDNDQVLILK